MVKLGVNIDHVATIRQARGGKEPDPVTAAALAEQAGADSITVHLREDRRHINDRDVEVLSRTIKTRMNLEMAATEEMKKIALDILPHSVCLVPEKREELTTEGGLDVVKQKKDLQEYVKALMEQNIIVSLFIDPSVEQVKAAYETGVEFIELHTGRYAELFDTKKEDEAFKELEEAAKLANKLGLKVNAGHGLNYWNVKRILTIPFLYELNIGHTIISRAVFTGMEKAVRDMKDILIL
ncbi:MAG TPA: pyridoxine 5'-phosphate synthase [Candidatus Gastranaerophilales bacterium]|nr:pyridoxine 5'-phosphate synthase [Candidatus Gastranaerophilales bacterium]